MKPSDIIGPLVVMAITGTAANAQAAAQLRTTKQDWSVFSAENPKECWAVTSPRASTAKKDGKTASVNRGEIGLFVTYRPGAGGGEISFRGGYPFAQGSSVGVTLNSGDKFSLFTQGEGAWTTSAESDARMISAMKGAGTVTVVGQSARGTTTTDQFSLMGVSAAIAEAQRLCR